MPVLLVFFVRNLEKGKRGLKFQIGYEEEFGGLEGSGEAPKAVYELHAVVEHLGKSRREGHYVSYVRGQSKVWYKVKTAEKFRFLTVFRFLCFEGFWVKIEILS